MDKKGTRYVQHSTHAACSTLLYSHFDGIIPEIVGRSLVRKGRRSCREHSNHYDLQPFFQDNEALVTFFEEEMQECGDISHIKPKYDAVKDIVDKSSGGVGTVFECLPTISSNN